MPVAALVVGAVASVAGTVMSYTQQKKAAKLQQQQQAVDTRRSRRQSIRQAQISRAQAVASGSAQGATGSSAAMGGVSSLSSQLGGEMGYSTQMSGLSRGVADATQKANTWGSVAKIGGTLFNYGDSKGATFEDVFKRKPFNPTHSGYSG